MNLKESFRYQNYLSLMLEQTERRLYNHDNAFDIIEKHYKSKADKKEKDEDIVFDMEKEQYKVIDYIDFAQFIIDEKSHLSMEIRKAKESIPQDVDGNVMVNKSMKSLVSAIDSILLAIQKRQKASKTYAYGYRFNEEGNQIRYEYPMEKISTLDFDPSVLKIIRKKLLKQSDDNSTSIDEAMICDCVKYIPKDWFDVNTSFEEAMETFMQSKNKN